MGDSHGLVSFLIIIFIILCLASPKKKEKNQSEYSQPVTEDVDDEELERML